MVLHVPHGLALAGWLLGWVLLVRLPRLSARALRGDAEEIGPPPDGAVTIVVPARNEAARLPGLLQDLAHERPAGSRVIVVDDHSDDGTADLARAHDFVEVMRPPPPPPGWTGKTNACWFATGMVPAGTLVFL